MKNKLKSLSKILLLSTILLAIPTTLFAHSGRTDSSGGHKDKNNVSGLGSYHYHCGRHPAHLHEGGICPYSSTQSSTTTKSKSKTSTNANTSSTTKAKSTSVTTDSSKNKKVEVEKITLNAPKAKIEINEELTIIATVTPDSANDKSITWNSSDTSVATVSNTGVVKAIKDGSVSISATSTNGKCATLNLIVNKPKVDVTELNLDESDFSLEVGKENRIIANVLPYEATDKTIKWTSSDDKVAKIDNGKVKALKAGEVTITAETSSGITKTCHIKVTEPAKASQTETTTNDNASAALGGAVIGAGVVGTGIWGIKKLKNKS